MRRLGKILAAYGARLRRLPADDSGVVMLETVLVFPLQLLITMAIIQVAHLQVATGVIQYAAFTAARTAAVLWGSEDSAAATQRAAGAAWVVCSTLNNSGGGTMTVRVPGNNYAYFKPGTDSPLALRVLAVGDAGNSTTASEAAGWPGNIIYAEVDYRYDLMVQLGGPLVYDALKELGRKTSVNPKTGSGQLVITQNARIPKPWPY